MFATAQYNISETRYDEVTNVARGFPNSNMNNYTLARQYATASTPTGGDGITRHYDNNRNMTGFSKRNSSGGVSHYDNRGNKKNSSRW